MSAVKKLFATALGLGAGLLVAEVALRVYNPIPHPLRGKDIVLPVHKRFVIRTPGGRLDEEIRWSLNSLGFRGPEPPAGPLAAVPSVIAVGGSTTECRYLSDGKDWPALLLARLGPRVPGLWINNAGLDGHSTFGHRVLLDQVIAELAPRHALFLVGVNDVGRQDLNEFDAALSPAAQSLRDRFVARSELLSTAQVLYRSARAFDLGLTHQWMVDLATTETGTVSAAALSRALGQHREGALGAYEARLAALVRETKAAGIRPILVTQPALFGDVPDRSSGVPIGPRLHGGRTAKERWATLELYNDVTRRVAAEQELPLVEAAREMEKDSAYFYDWMHLTNAGAARLADIVEPTLAAELEAAR